MDNVISLTGYRYRTRKTYLSRHGAQLEHFIERFIATHVDVDFRSLTHEYQKVMYGEGGESWDYVDFREILGEALDRVFGVLLYQMLKKQPWFDTRLITQEEIKERCLSAYIMGQSQVAFL